MADKTKIDHNKTEGLRSGRLVITANFHGNFKVEYEDNNGNDKASS